jgi:hypothetical protein
MQIYIIYNIHNLYGTECQEALSFATDSKIYTPNRVPQGAVDSALHFQSVMMECFKDLLDKCVLIWMDVILLFAKAQEEFLVVLEKVLQVVKTYRLKINPNKTRLFLSEVCWCGRIYDGTGMRQVPERLQGLRDLRSPKTVAELQLVAWISPRLCSCGEHVATASKG